MGKKGNATDKTIAKIIENHRKEEKKKQGYTDDIDTSQAIKIDNYIDNVKLYIDHQPFFYDKAGIFWFWNKEKFKWEIWDETDVMNDIDDKLGFCGQTVGTVVKGKYMEAFRRVGRKNTPKDTKKTWIQFRDKIVDVITSEEFNATPKHFMTNPLPHRIGESHETPTMDRIFTEWVGLDNIRTLYEIIAYCTLPDYPISRIFCFLGGGMNGKSKFLELIKRFLGEDNTTSTELDSLINSRFEVTKLFKKLACFMGETNFNEIHKTSMLKKLSGGDLIGYEMKNKNPFDGKNYAKILIATNNLPSTSDKTMGFYRRWLLIDFPNSFNEKKDILDDIPEEEYDNLSLKVISILHGILTKREFINEGTVEDRAKKYEDRSNPLDKFLNEFTEDSYDGHIFKYDFKKRFNEWCRENKYRKLSDIELFKIMKTKYNDSKRQANWARDSQEKPILWVWEGLGWKE